MGVKSVQIPQLAVFLLGAADEQQQLSDLPPDKRGLLNHQVLAEKEEKNERIVFMSSATTEVEKEKQQ